MCHTISRRPSPCDEVSRPTTFSVAVAAAVSQREKGREGSRSAATPQGGRVTAAAAAEKK
ncbi:MAG: hypothetical protein WC483_00100 [Candidatus Paceibacterota bacterium]